MFNRENFEEHVFDYLDGNMPAEQESLFLAFLKDHPELEEEVMAIKDVQLPAEPVDFPGKSELFKLNQSGQDKLLDNSFEEASIAYYEGDLDQRQKQELEALIQHNDAFRYPFEAFSKTYLKPDETIEFSGKSSLKKLTITQKRTRIFTLISSAAAVAILLILFIRPAREELQPITVQEQGIQRETIRLPHVNPIPAQLITRDFSGSFVASLVSQPVQEVVPENRPDLSLPLLATNNLLIPNNIKSEEIVLPSVIREELVNTEFMSLGDFARERLFSRIFNRENNNSQENNTFWNLAMNGIEGLSNITDGDISLEREINQTGEVERFTFETAVFGFSAPARND
ncbi:MAG: hypothetical protein ISS19_03235 [Bacteroidales bacterium]|nr:hypothetical protein [Bacteroidales bacterium]